MINRLKSVKDVAPLLNCSEITIRRLIAARKIPFHKIGYRYMFSDDDIFEYLRQVKVESKVTVGNVPS